MAGMFLQRLSKYGQRLLSSTPFTKYLLVTNVVMGATIDCCGDVIAQRVVERSDVTNWKRSGRMATVSAALCVPAHFWYLWLERCFPLRTSRHIIKKVALDVLAAGPVFFSAFYLGTCVCIDVGVVFFDWNGENEDSRRTKVVFIKPHPQIVAIFRISPVAQLLWELPFQCKDHIVAHFKMYYHYGWRLSSWLH